MPVGAEVYRGPQYPAASLSRMCEEFTEAELLAAGIAWQTDCGAGLLPAPGWSRPGSLLLALRRSPEEQPFDILTECGALAGGPALFASVEDAATMAAVDNKHGFLLIAGSINDVAVLRAAGLPVTLANGILPLDRPKLDDFMRAQFFRRQSDIDDDLADKARDLQSDELAAGYADTAAALPGRDGGGSFSGDAIYAPQELIFVAWSPHELSLQEPPCLELIRNAFRALGLHLGLDVSELYQWAPTSQELETLRFSLEFGETKRVQHLLRQSLDENSVDLIDAEKADEVARQSFEVALADLQQAVTEFTPTQSSQRRLQAALDGYFKAVERDFLEPLQSQALSCRSPIRRNLHLAAAEICRQIYRDSYWPRTVADLLQNKRNTRDRRPENFLRAASALTQIAARLLA